MKKINIKARYLLSAILLTALLSCSITYGILHFDFSGHRDPQFSANLYVSINGQDQQPVGNVVTDIAENSVRDGLGFGNVSTTLWGNQTKYIALGNATVAQTLTKLTTECVNGSTGAFGRALGTVTAWMNGTDRAYNVTHTFTENATETINACGLHWDGTASGDNNLFAVAAITQTAFASGDNCTITWVITIDAN